MYGPVDLKYLLSICQCSLCVYFSCVTIYRSEWERCVGAEGGGRSGDELLRQVLDLRLWRDVHHGLLRWEAGWIQNSLHAALPALPLSLSGWI